MRLLIYSCLLLATLAAQASAEEGPWIESYVGAGEVERIYGSADDEIDAATANQLLLGLTNEARQENGVLELEWHPLAGVLAQQHADEMATERYVNHYDLAGRKCELRFNALGQVDHVSENIAYYQINHAIYLTPQLVRRMHQHWLDSPSHRANMLAAHHTHFGCGLRVVSDGDTSYIAGAAEFVADYGDYGRLPQRASPGASFELEGQLDPARTRLAYISIGSEDLPRRRSVEYQLKHIGGYSPPEPAMRLVPAVDALAQLPEGWRHVSPAVQYNPRAGDFSVEIELQQHWPAASYYITVYAVRPEDVRADGTPDYAHVFPVMVQVVQVG